MIAYPGTDSSVLFLVALVIGARGIFARHSNSRPHERDEEVVRPSQDQLSQVQVRPEESDAPGAKELKVSASEEMPADATTPNLQENLMSASRWLASEHEHMLAVLNQLRVGVVIVNEEGRIVFMSKAAERLFDHENPDALGQSWQKVLPLDDQTRVRIAELMSLPAFDRAGLSVQRFSGNHRRFWMEIEIADDPKEPRNKILYFYDVSEIADLRTQLTDLPQHEGLYGQSRAMLSVFREIRVVARGDTTVLIDGETGTGKELVARAIHHTGARKDKPFLALNCAGLSESLLGSQLFGHRRGSFTGAIADQVGLFEAAQGGTLFLDEIGDIPLTVQSSLLRVLQEKEITRLGETKPRKVDVRIVAATHRDLGREVGLGNFREDLYYRIRVARISLPPLRERTEDIPLLVKGFLSQACGSHNVPEPDVDAETLIVLSNYPWPGNVRELKSAVESALIHSDGRIIRRHDLPADVAGSANTLVIRAPQSEKDRVLGALERANGNRSEAARLLGVSRATFYRILARLQITGAEDPTDSSPS